MGTSQPILLIILLASLSWSAVLAGECPSGCKCTESPTRVDCRNAGLTTIPKVCAANYSMLASCLVKFGVRCETKPFLCRFTNRVGLPTCSYGREDNSKSIKHLDCSLSRSKVSQCILLQFKKNELISIWSEMIRQLNMPNSDRDRHVKKNYSNDEKHQLPIVQSQMPI